MATISLGGIRPCAKCGAEKPWTAEFFRPTAKALRSVCKTCDYRAQNECKKRRRDQRTAEEKAADSAKRAAYYKANQDRIKAQQKQWRDANKDVRKRGYEAWKARDPEHVRAVWRASHKKHCEARRARQKIYRRENAEKVRADYREWREKNREHVREYMREYGPKWAEANREKRRAAVKRWRERNPKKAHHSTQAYWARKHGAEGSHTFAEKQALLKKQEGKCFYCRKPLTDFHADHFIPLSKGGTDYIENIRIACPNCNCRKSDKMPWDWMPERFSAP